MRKMALALSLVGMVLSGCEKDRRKPVDTTLNDEEAAASPSPSPTESQTIDEEPELRDSPSDSHGMTDALSELDAQWTSSEQDREATVATADGSEPNRPPVGDEASFITADDYPPSSIRAEEEGKTTLRYTINRFGRVENCQVTVSSGSTALDQAACRALTRRGRYTPATGEDGQPVDFVKSRNVVWTLPQN